MSSVVVEAIKLITGAEHNHRSDFASFSLNVLFTHDFTVQLVGRNLEPRNGANNREEQKTDWLCEPRYV